jgi:hypothetical protein
MEWTLGLCRTPHAKHLKQRVTIRLGEEAVPGQLSLPLGDGQRACRGTSELRTIRPVAR